MHYVSCNSVTMCESSCILQSESMCVINAAKINPVPSTCCSPTGQCAGRGLSGGGGGDERIILTEES